MARLLHHNEVLATDGREVDAVRERPLVTGTIGQVLVLLGAAMLLLSGALTIIRAGLGHDLATPVVQVFGYSHTAWLGIVEVGVGVLLLVAGLSAASRSLALAVGILLIVAGIVVRADVQHLPHELAIEQSYGNFVLVTGVIATVGGILPAGWTRRWERSTRVPADQV